MTWGCYEKMTLEEQFSGSVSRLVRMGWGSRRKRVRRTMVVSAGEGRLVLSACSEQCGGWIDVAVHCLVRSI